MCCIQEAEEGESEAAKRKATGLRDSGLRDWAGEREQPVISCHAHAPRIRAFAFQRRVFMRSCRVWEKTKNMAS